MIVSETLKKIKSWTKPAAESAILVGIMLIAFILGRISAFSETQGAGDFQVIYPPLVTTHGSYPAKQKVPSSPSDSSQPPNSETPANWAYTASKTGKVYYPRDCGSISRVKPENRVYFASESEAQAAGLSLSAACQ